MGNGPAYGLAVLIGRLLQKMVDVIRGLALITAAVAWILTACFVGFWTLVVGLIVAFGVICHSGMTALSRGLRWRNG
jgi:hypothetical protein